LKSKSILSVKNLKISFPSGKEENIAVDGVSFQLRKGEILGIVGESGSGKSLTSLSILGLTPPSGKLESTEIIFDDLDIRTKLNDLNEKEFRKIRGNRISMIFQEPSSSLNPVYTCGNQVREMFTTHKKISRKEAKKRTLELFEKVNLFNSEKIYHSYPHEISGGQMQRVMIAMAMACQPAILLADEPTTALDVTIQKNILELMDEMRKEMGTSIIFISHDLGVIAEIADRVLVMYKGKIVEEGTIEEIFVRPQHPYTKGLLACRPRLDVKLNVLPTIEDFMAENESEGGERKFRSVGEALILNAETKGELIQKRMDTIKGGPLIRIKKLKKYYPIKSGVFGKIKGFLKAVDSVSFDIYPGETIGLVGESGCGKTTLGKTILKLVDSTDGTVMYDGKVINHLSEGQLRPMRKDIQIIFQDPYSSLNPKHRIGYTILEPMKIHGILKNDKERKERVYELLEKVNLKPEHFERYPHQFSGGQRQRISIARALALNPKFIVCDESVSALDVSIQAQVLNLLNQLKKEFNFTYLFISHDLSVIKFIADRILVMKDGKLVEVGYSDALFERPKHEYTRQLINAIPKSDPEDIYKIQMRKKTTETR